MRGRLIDLGGRLVRQGGRLTRANLGDSNAQKFFSPRQRLGDALKTMLKTLFGCIFRRIDFQRNKNQSCCTVEMVPSKSLPR